MACTYEPIDNSKNPLNVTGSISKGKLAAQIYKQYSNLNLKFSKKENVIQDNSEFEAMTEKEKIDYIAGRAKSLHKNGTDKSDLVTRIGKELPDGYGKIINSGVGKYLSAPYVYVFKTGNFKISAIVKRLQDFVKETGDSIFDTYNKSLMEGKAEYQESSHLALLSVSEAIVDNAIKNNELEELIKDTHNPLINMAPALKVAIGLMAMNRVGTSYTSALLDGDAVTVAKYQYLIDNAKQNSKDFASGLGVMGHFNRSSWEPYTSNLLTYDTIKEQAFESNPGLEKKINSIQEETQSDIKKGQKKAKDNIDNISDNVIKKRKSTKQNKSTSLDIKVIKAQLKDELLAHRAEYLKNKGRTLNSTIDPALVDYGVAVMKSYIKAGVKITGKTLAKLFIDDLGFEISDDEAKLLVEYADDLIEENEINKSIDKLKAKINDLNNKIHYAKTNDAIYKPESRAKIEKEVSDIEKELLREIDALNNLYQAEKDRIKAKNNTEKRIEKLKDTLSDSKEQLDNIINGIEVIVENTTKAVKELTQEEIDLNLEIKKVNDEIKNHPTKILKDTLNRLKKEVLRVSENVAHSTSVKRNAEYDLGLYNEQQKDIIAQINEQKQLLQEYKDKNNEELRINALEKQLNDEYQKNAEILNGTYKEAARNTVEAKKESDRISELRERISDAKQEGKSLYQLNKLKEELASYENNIVPIRKKREAKENKLSQKNLELKQSIEDTKKLIKAEKDKVSAKNNIEKRIEKLKNTLSESKEHLESIINGIEVIVENTKKATRELTEEEINLKSEIKKVNDEIKIHPTTVLNNTLNKLKKELTRINEGITRNVSTKNKAEYDLRLYNDQQKGIISQINEQEQLLKEARAAKVENRKIEDLEKRLSDEYQKNSEIEAGIYKSVAKNVSDTKKESDKVYDLRKKISNAKQEGKSLEQLNKLKNDLALYENNIIPARKKRESKEIELSEKNKELKESIDKNKALIKAEKDRIKAENYSPLTEKGKAIKKRITSDIVNSSNTAQDFANRVSRLLGQRTKKVSKVASTKEEQLNKVLSDINFIAENIESFDSVINDAIAEIDADNNLTEEQKEAYKQEIENKYGDIVKNPISNNTIDEYIKKSLRIYGISLSNISTMDAVEKKQIYDELVFNLTKSIPEEQAKQIIEDFTNQFNELVASEGIKNLKEKLDKLKTPKGNKIKNNRVKYINKSVYDIIAKQGFILDEQLDELLLHALDIPALSNENKALLANLAQELSKFPEGIWADNEKPAFSKLIDKIKKEEQRRLDYNGDSEARWYNRVNSLNLWKGSMEAVVKGLISNPVTVILAATSTALKQIGAIQDVLLNEDSQDAIGFDKGTLKYVAKSFNPYLYVKAANIYRKELWKHRQEIKSLSIDVFKTGFNSMESSVEANKETNFFNRNVGHFPLKPKTMSVEDIAKYAYNYLMILETISNRSIICVDIMNRAGMTNWYTERGLARQLKLAELSDTDSKIIEGLQRSINDYKKAKSDCLDQAKQEYKELRDSGHDVRESYVHVRQYELLANFGDYHKAVDNARNTVRRTTEQADVEGTLGAYSKASEKVKNYLGISNFAFLFQRTMLNALNHGLDFNPPVGLLRAIRGKSLLGDVYSNERRKQSLIRAVNMSAFISLYLFAHQDDDDDDNEGMKVFRLLLREANPIWLEGRGFGEGYKHKYDKKNTIANRELEAKFQKKFNTAYIGFGDKDSKTRFAIPMSWLPTGLMLSSMSEYENYRVYGKEKLSLLDMNMMVITNAAYDVFDTALGGLVGDIKTKRVADMTAGFASQLVPLFQPIYKDLYKMYGVVTNKAQQEPYIKNEYKDETTNILHSMYLTVSNNSPLMSYNDKSYDSFGNEIKINSRTTSLSGPLKLMEGVYGPEHDKDLDRIYKTYNDGINFAFNIKSNPLLTDMPINEYKEYLKVNPEEEFVPNSQYRDALTKLYKTYLLDKVIIETLENPKVSKEDKQVVIDKIQKLALKKTKEMFSRDLSEKELKYKLEQEDKKIEKENLLIELGLVED